MPEIDARLFWLRQALHKMYREMDPDAEISGLGIVFRTKEGTVINYTMESCSPEITRQIITGDARIKAAEFRATAIDLTPETVIPE